MTPVEAATLLELPVDATPEQLEARFTELRIKLEDKIAKAPTPGLRAKYRDTLDGITLAFELLTIAADSSSLPVLKREPEVKTGQPSAGEISPARKPRITVSNRREFTLLAIAVLAFLGAGGWWLVKTRAVAAEQARIEAEAKITAARQEALFVQLHSLQAEAKVRWEVLENELVTAERTLGELKSDLRNTREMPAPQLAELTARQAAQTTYVTWLQSFVAKHPAKTLLAKFDALLSAKAVEAAASLESDLATNLKYAEDDLAIQRVLTLSTTSRVEFRSTPEKLPFTYTDAYGRSAQGVTSGFIDLPFGPLAVSVRRGPGWSDFKQQVTVTRGEPLTINPVFATGALQVTSNPSGLNFEVSNAFGYLAKGTTPANLAEVPSGEVSVHMHRPNWPDTVETARVAANSSQTVEVGFSTGKLNVTSTPSGLPFEVTDTSGKLHTGTTPAALELIPGTVELRVGRRGFQPQVQRLEIKSNGQTNGSAYLVGADVLVTVDEPRLVIRLNDFNFGQKAGVMKDVPPGTYTLGVYDGRTAIYTTPVTVAQPTGPSEPTRFDISIAALSEKNIHCPNCSGSGHVEESEKCGNCFGSGKQGCGECYGSGTLTNLAGQNARRCPACRGTGEIACRQCDGRGKEFFTRNCRKCDGVGRISQLQASR